MTLLFVSASQACSVHVAKWYELHGIVSRYFVLLRYTAVYRDLGDTGWILLAVWLSGNTLASINVVALRQTQLVLGWVTVCGRVNHLGM